MTGPATGLGEDSSPEELRDSYVTVLVARHFEAMWAHMRRGLEGLAAPHHRLMDQVMLPSPIHGQMHLLVLLGSVPLHQRFAQS